MENGYKKSTKQSFIALIVIIVAIGLGLGVFFHLIHNKKHINRKKPQKLAIYVKTKPVKKVNTVYKIMTYGHILPKKEIALSPLVSGKIVYVNPNFYIGKRIKKGETVLKIDKEDYLIDLKIKKANLDSLREDLKLQIGKQKAAKLELAYAKKLNLNIDKTSRYLILKKPNVKKILDEIEIAKQQLKSAKLNLERTNIKAPFDSYVTNKYVDLGSVVSSNTKLANLVYAKEFYVDVPVNFSYLGLINLDNTTKAKIFLDKTHYIYGTFQSLNRSTDKNGVMANLTFSIEPNNNLNRFMLINSYVNVEIYGKKLKNVFRIPSKALRDDDTVWVFDNGKLKIKSINVVFKCIDSVYTYDLDDNDEIVISNINLPIDGMPLKKVKNDGK